MERENTGEPDKKRPHLNSVSPTMARNSSSPSSNKSVDASVLQYQNQKLVQQLDIQKHELHDMETKISELKERQSSYDDVLITVNQLWNQLVDDLILLGVRAGGGQSALKVMDHVDQSRGSIPSCSAEDMFLCRLLEVDRIESSNKDETVKHVEEALALRHLSTRELMKFLEDTIDSQRVKTESIAQTLNGQLSGEDAIIHLSNIDSMMKEEAKNLREVIDVLHLKHKEYADCIQTCTSSHSVDQSEIKRLSGELEESMLELEESRRKLVNLKMQKEVASGTHTVAPGAVNGSFSPEKHADRAMGLRELKDSIEEAKILAADRLSELHEAEECNRNLSKQAQDLQNEVKGDKYVLSSRAYNVLKDQLQHWNAEGGRYKAMIDLLQADKTFVVRRERELNLRAESANAARNNTDNAENRIQEMELRLQKHIVEKNDLELKMEDAIQDAGRKDIKVEFQVMASALSKEMEMMEAQVNRWKETAHEAHSLREKAQSLNAMLGEKTNEQKCLEEQCAKNELEIRNLKALVEKRQKEKLERQILLDMYSKENYDNRSLEEIKESERRAHLQAEVLRNALAEHSLELRVKAANEAEAACQQRLSAAQAEIAELRAELDSSERGVLKLKEAIKSKEQEGQAYLSEIETIGQAYEDMQTQNQHLLQQVTERDEHNIKLVSESVKAKQRQSLLLSEKQALTKQLERINVSIKSSKTRIGHSEEQVKVCLTEALKSAQEDTHLAVSLETAKLELSDADKELKWLKSAAAATDKEYEQLMRKINDMRAKLDSERAERMQLEEEIKETNSKVAELSSESGEAAVQRLQAEINSCKSILKCSVCSDRPKEVVILKCYHLFCNPCIQRNLELRHRKCPGCGTAFGQNDVRFVKI